MAVETVYLRDIDLLWLATDSEGHVAVFATGGQGHVAQTAMPFVQSDMSPTELPIEWPARAHGKASRADVELAMSGLYVYNWADVHRVTRAHSNLYELQATPTRPITLAELPESLRVEANATQLLGLRFADAMTIDLPRWVPCADRDRPAGEAEAWWKPMNIPPSSSSPLGTTASPVLKPMPSSLSRHWHWLALITVLILLFKVIGAGVDWVRNLQNPQSVVTQQVSTPEVPVVMRTPGGLLEVATIRATERFSRRDSKSFWGVDLGETVTEIAVPVTYRFHIPLARQWPVRLEQGVAEVDAPALSPSLPVAFDTTQLQTWGRNGWARFNKDESLAALQRSLSPQLAQRATAPHYRELATEAARQTVAEYTRSWLTASGKGPVREVRVRFPGEASATAPTPERPATRPQP